MNCRWSGQGSESVLDVLKAYLFFPRELDMKKTEEDLLDRYHKEIPGLMKKVSIVHTIEAKIIV